MENKKIAEDVLKGYISGIIGKEDIFTLEYCKNTLLNHYKNNMFYNSFRIVNALVLSKATLGIMEVIFDGQFSKVRRYIHKIMKLEMNPITLEAISEKC